MRSRVRRQLGVDDTETVVVFLGRLNRDKGVLDLAEAMCHVDVDRPVRLVLAGSDEESLAPQIETMLAMKGVRCSYLGHVSHPESLLCASDIFCLPSHREGFGLSVIEAAACEVPAVASNVYGLTDAVVNEETGLLFPVGDARALATCLTELISNPEFRQSLGRKARIRVIEEFEQERLTRDLADYYRRLLMDLTKESKGWEGPS
jgi:glycosyltransferase involved in cell wall biosynthesis